MILYENGYITLDYDPATDIQYAECPDINEYDLLQLHQAFSIVAIHFFTGRNLSALSVFYGF